MQKLSVSLLLLCLGEALSNYMVFLIVFLFPSFLGAEELLGDGRGLFG